MSITFEQGWVWPVSVHAELSASASLGHAAPTTTPPRVSQDHITGCMGAWQWHAAMSRLSSSSHSHDDRNNLVQ